jgi:hypothetical protein
MPALFAYLIAVGLLLGGGYGALSWLAAPEPVKVAAKAKPRPPSHEASSKTAPFETNSLAVDSSQVASGTNNPPSWSQSEMSVAASERGAEAESSGLPQAQQSRVANAEVSPAEARQGVGQPALAMATVSESNAAVAAAARPVKRPHPRQARSRSGKSALAMMTLRTIEFADGRRVTRLIPYRGPERAPAFEPDE